MKGIAMQSKVQLSEETKLQLTKEVKETLATSGIKSIPLKFTVSDLWNQRRNSCSASMMMRKWNLN